MHAGINEPTVIFATSVPALTKYKMMISAGIHSWVMSSLTGGERLCAYSQICNVDLYNEARVYTSHTLPLMIITYV